MSAPRDPPPEICALTVGSVSAPVRRLGKPFTKGDPRISPGGQTREQRDLRKALEGNGLEVHAALLALVRAGNVQAVLYAHQQLVGRAPEKIEIKTLTETKPEQDLSLLTDEQLDQLVGLVALTVVPGGHADE